MGKIVKRMLLVIPFLVNNLSLSEPSDSEKTDKKFVQSMFALRFLISVFRTPCVWLEYVNTPCCTKIYKFFLTCFLWIVSSENPLILISKKSFKLSLFITAWKVSIFDIRSFSCPYFPAVGLNTERAWDTFQGYFSRSVICFAMCFEKNHLAKKPVKWLWSLKSFSTVFATCRSSRHRCSVRKGVFRNFTKFRKKHLC